MEETALRRSWGLGLVNFVFVFPTLLDKFYNVGAFGLYAGLNIVALIMIVFLVPETKQRTLEELNYIFAVPTRTHARYQLTKTLPYFIKRWALWQKNATVGPLYTFDRMEVAMQNRVSDK